MNTQELNQAIASGIVELKEHSLKADRIETNLVVRTCQLITEHGDSSKVSEVADALHVHGSNGASRAFKYLIDTYTGISVKTGKISDTEKHNKNKEQFTKVLTSLENQGLKDWFASTKDTLTDDEKKAKRAAQKAKKKAEIIAEYKAERANDLFLRAVDSYEAQLAAIYKENPQQALDMVKADTAQVRNAISSMVSRSLSEAS